MTKPVLISSFGLECIRHIIGVFFAVTLNQRRTFLLLILIVFLQNVCVSVIPCFCVSMFLCFCMISQKGIDPGT